MRAGLLSQPSVIERLNQDFVCTWGLVSDVNELAQKGHPLAKTMAATWEYPVELMFLSPHGELISSLNSYKNFPRVHPEVSVPPGKGKKRAGGDPTHTEVFLEHLDEHFPRTVGPLPGPVQLTPLGSR